MRIATSLLLPLAAFLFSAAGARAQLELPLADYSGSLKVAITCADGSTTKFSSKGAVSIDGQTGGNILASAEFVGKRAGVECTLTLELTGIVNTIGRVLGTYTSTIDCADGTLTNGSGNFDGRYVPGRLAFLIEGVDEDCTLAASFKGKGSPGTALCASLNQVAVGKLAKRFYGAWSQYFKFAHVQAAGPVLQTAVGKIHTAFAKASEKAVKKSTKAGGTCAKDPAVPGTVTAKIKLDTLDPMAQGFQKNRPLDRAARSGMAKLQGTYFVARLKIETTYGLKLDPLKRTAALEKARDAFVAKSTKLLTKVTDLGLVWTGPSPQAMATDIDQFITFLVAYYK